MNHFGGRQSLHSDEFHFLLITAIGAEKQMRNGFLIPLLSLLKAMGKLPRIHQPSPWGYPKAYTGTPSGEVGG